MPIDRSAAGLFDDRVVEAVMTGLAKIFGGQLLAFSKCCRLCKRRIELTGAFQFANQAVRIALYKAIA